MCNTYSFSFCQDPLCVMKNHIRLELPLLHRTQRIYCKMGSRKTFLKNWLCSLSYLFLASCLSHNSIDIVYLDYIGERLFSSLLGIPSLISSMPKFSDRLLSWKTTSQEFAIWFRHAENSFHYLSETSASFLSGFIDSSVLRKFSCGRLLSWWHTAGFCQDNELLHAIWVDFQDDFFHSAFTCLRCQQCLWLWPLIVMVIYKLS